MVPPGNYEYIHAEHPYEMTVADFYDKLQLIYRELGLEEFYQSFSWMIERDSKPDRSLLLRFLGLDTDVCSWSGDKPEVPGKMVYERLNEFLANNVPSELGNLREKWEKQLESMRKLNIFPTVRHCIEAVIGNVDKEELKARYKIERVPEFGDVDSITIILGWILFWFAYLPCTEAAQEAQASYRRYLRDKLTLLLNPLTDEFSRVSGAAQDNPALRAMLEMYCCPLSVRISDSEDSRTFEKIDKENTKQI